MTWNRIAAFSAFTSRFNQFTGIPVHSSGRSTGRGKLWLLVLFALLAALSSNAAAQKGEFSARPAVSGASGGSFAVFDAPNALLKSGSGTVIVALDAAGDAAGVYGDAKGNPRAFIIPAGGKLTPFDVPSMVSAPNKGTVPIAFDAAGDLLGIFGDGRGTGNGFIRSASGAITIITHPSAGIGKGGTFPQSINANGDVAGIYIDSNGLPHGFVLPNGGSFLTVDPIAPVNNDQAANAQAGTVYVTLNASRQSAGFYMDSNGLTHGFVSTASGSTTSFDAPGAGTANGSMEGTYATSIDASGNVAGVYLDGNNAAHGFVRAANGAVTSIDAPGAGMGSYQGTYLFDYPFGFDAAGDVAGVYIDVNDGIHSFVRTASGTITSFDAPQAATSTEAMLNVRRILQRMGLNRAGSHSLLGRIRGFQGGLGRILAHSEVMGHGLSDGSPLTQNNTISGPQDLVPATVGIAFNAGGNLAGVSADSGLMLHGFLRTAAGGMTVFDAPGAGTAAVQGTVPFAMNAAGQIAGVFADENFVMHGFIATLGQAATTTTLQTAPSASTFGMPITLTANVTNAAGNPPDGETVQFVSGTTVVGSAQLASGVATWTVTSAPAGTDEVTAVYPGDLNNAGSASSAATVTVGQASSSVKLSVAANSTVYGSSVGMLASVTGHFGGVPTGAVSFFNGTTIMGTVPITGNSARFDSRTLQAGSYSITAVYGGDNNFTASTSTASSLTITPATPVITWKTPASISSLTPLSSVQLNAEASTAGSFVYTPGAGTLLSTGTQQLSTTFTPADSVDFTPATATASIVVTNPTLEVETLSVTPSATSITTAQSLLVTINLSLPNISVPRATGSVSLHSGAYTSASAVISNLSASITVPAGALAVGQDVLTATYIPDSASAPYYVSSSGSSAPVQVTLAAPGSGMNVGLAITWGGSVARTVTPGAVVTLTATVTNGNAPVSSGMVNFCNAAGAACTDIHLLGSAALNSTGVATLAFRPGMGNRVYKAVFTGNPTNVATTSAIQSLAVSGAEVSSLTLTESGGVNDYTLTATLGALQHRAPSGTINLIDTTYGNSSLESISLSNPGTGPFGWNQLTSAVPTNGTLPYAMTVGDFNGDGIADVAVVSPCAATAMCSQSAPEAQSVVTILLGNGDGSFSAATSTPLAGYFGLFVVASDFNGDGKQDLAIANACGMDRTCSSAGTITVLLGDGKGGFTASSASPSTGNGPMAMALGDFNGDGILDLVVANNSSSTVTILLGNGDGTFTAKPGSPATGMAPLSIVAGDFNGDGKLDLAVGNSSGTMTILLGNGDGTFTAKNTAPACGSYPEALTAADFNGDGKLDLAVASAAGDGVQVFLGNGDGTFTAGQDLAVETVSWAVTGDINGDGIPDLILENHHSGPVVYLGNGDGTFTYPSAQPASTGGTAGQGIVAADLNGDGVTDIAAFNTTYDNNGNPQLVVESLVTGLTLNKYSMPPVSVSGVGPHQIVAQYTGDSNIATSISNAVSLYAPTPAPVFSLAAGVYTSAQTLAMSDAVGGAQIYYTVDGSMPDQNSKKYSGPIVVTENETVQAVALGAGYGLSPATSASYILNLPATAAPVFSPAGGYYATPVTVTITDAMPGAVIYYSTDGGVTNNVYAGPISVSTSETINAWAIAPGMGNSNFSPSGSFAEAQYAIGTSNVSLIYSVAGDWRPGYAGDGGLATQAQLGWSYATAEDMLGNIYIADAANNVIRKVTASTGIITTIAGNGRAGYAGDGGPAASAQFNDPSGLAVDNQGNLYIADTNNNSIRMISSKDGTISTIAGGRNGLCSPSSIALGNNGTLVIAEGYCSQVATLNLSTGAVTQIAGGFYNWGSSGDGGSALNARFAGIFGVAVDGAGNIYLGDTGNQVIRRISASTGIVTRYAGNYGCTGSYAGVVPEDVWATGICLYLPSNSTSLVSDRAGNLYFTEGLVRVRRVDANTGNLHSVVNQSGNWWDNYGDGSPAVLAWTSGPSGLSFDQSGNLYFYDNEGRVRMVTNPIPAPSQPAATPTFSVAAGTYSSTQVVTLSDTTPGATIYYTTDGTEATAGSSEAYTGPINLAASDTINAVAIAPGYQSSSMASATYAITSAPPLQINLVAGSISSPAPLVNAFFPNGVPAIGANFGYPSSITTDSAGNFYFTDTSNNAVWMVNAKTQMLSLVAGNGTSGYSGDGGLAVEAQLNSPRGIAVDAAGDVFIADTNNNVIREVNASTGKISTIAGVGVKGYSGDGGPALQAQLYNPQALWLSNGGNLYIADPGNERVRMVVLSTGVISTVAGAGNSGSYGGDGGLATATSIPSPDALAEDSAGNLYIAGQSQIFEVAAATGKIAVLAGTGIYGYTGDGGAALQAQVAITGNSLAVDAAGNLYFATNGAVRMVTASTGKISTLVGRDTIMGTSSAETADLGYGSLWLQANFQVEGLAFDASGNLYVADEDGGNNIREILFNNGGKVTAPPTFSEPGGTYSTAQRIALSDGTPNATIYYTTDGSTPSTSSAVYAGPIAVAASELVQAIAVASGYTQSTVVYADYTIAPQAAAPVFSVPSGTYTLPQTVSISDASPGATIYYAISGGGVSTGWVPYNGAFTVASNETVQAVATSANYSESPITTANYTVTLAATTAPVITPGTGVYSAAQTVSITDSTPNAVIYYTTDGSALTDSSAYYSGAFTVSATSTVNAIAVAPGLNPSGVTSVQLLFSGGQTPMIYTIAGNGTYGFSGDGGSALLAEIGSIQGVAVDAAGNLFLADSNANAVRKVAAGTGIITTIAGTGIGGYSGDGGPATSAQLNYPDAVVVDGSGNLYIADGNNYRIRKVDGNGAITTLFNLAALNNSNFLSPSGLALDGKGNLYFADYCSVFEVPVQGATSATLVAGQLQCNGGFGGDNGPATSAFFNGIGGIGLNGSGNLFIADSGNNRIRMVNAKTGIVNTIAGNGMRGSSGDGGQATSASLHSPASIVLDNAGNLYIADEDNGAIRMVSGGVITRYAGMYSSGFSATFGDGGPAFQAELNHPLALAMDQSGDLFIAQYNSRIRMVSTAQAPPVAATSTPTFSVSTGSFAATQTVTITDSTPGAAIYISLDGSLNWDGYKGPISIAATSTLQAVSVAPGYLASAPASATYTITTPPAAVITTVAGTGVNGMVSEGESALNSNLGWIVSITMDGAGNFYLGDYEYNTVWKIAAGSGVITRFAGMGFAAYSGDGGQAVNAALSAPFGLAADSHGNVYIADTNNYVVRKVDASGVITTYAGTGQFTWGDTNDGKIATSAGLTSVYGVAVDATGNLYLTDSDSCRVRKVAYGTQIITTVAGASNLPGNNAGPECGNNGDGNPAAQTELNYPTGLTFDGNGNLYIAENFGADIRKVAVSDSTVSTVAGIGLFGYTGDGGPASKAEINADETGSVAVDPAGNVYIADSSTVIREITASDGLINTIGGTGIEGFYGDSGPLATAELNFPQSPVFDGTGNLYIADANNYRIRKISFPNSPLRVATPVFSLAPGTYVGSQTLTITDANADATIYYTTDGSKPTKNSEVYSGALTIATSETVRAMAAQNGLFNSSTVNEAFVILAPQTISFTAIPSPLTLSTGTVTLQATASSNLPVTFSVLSGPASVSGNALTLNGTGNVVVAADQAGNGAYAAALEATQTVAVVAGVLTANVSSLSFGSVPVGVTSQAQTVVITNATLLAATGVTITATGDFAAASTCTTIPVLGTCSVSVSFVPSASGARTGSVTVGDTQSANALSISLSGTGTAAGIQVTPATLNFGNQIVNTASIGQMVTIQNTGSTALTVSSVAVTGDFASTGTCGTVPAGSNCSLTVMFTPTATGTRNGTLTLTDSNGGSSQTQVVNLSGVGAQAGALLTPAVQSFPGTLIGASSFTLNATLSNTGTAALTGITISIQGDFTESSTCNASLAPGSTCTIGVTYVPTLAGGETGTLSVSDNLGVQNVTLNGIGLAPGASLSSTQLLFGGQLVNTASLAQSVVFTNTGTGAISIASVTPTGAFTETDNCFGSVAASASCGINVVFAPVASGTQTGAITITDTAGTQTISLQGQGTDPGLSLSPSFVNFGAQQVSTASQAQTLIATNTGTVPLTLNPVGVSNNFVGSDLCNVTLQPGGTCSISLTFAPTAIGNLTGSVQISDTNGAVSTLATATGQGTLPGIAASPASVSFGSVVVGATSNAQTVTVSNFGTAPLTIGKVTGTGDFAEMDNCANQVIAPNGYCVISATMTPTTQGTRTGSIQFVDNADGVHTIALSGMGQQAGVDITPVSLAFGSLPFVSLSQVANATGTSLSVLVTNSGSAPLVISSITATGDFTAGSNCGTSLAGGASCAVTVVFVPTAVGHRTGTLTISDNAGGGTQLVSLAGDGSPAGLTMTPPVLNFGAVAVGTTSAPQTATLRNNTGLAITNLTIVASGEFAESDNCGTTLANGSSCTLSIEVTPDISSSVTGTITISAGGTVVVQNGAMRRTGAIYPHRPEGTTGASSNTAMDVGVVSLTAGSSAGSATASQLIFYAAPAGSVIAGGNAGNAITVVEGDAKGNPVGASDSILLSVTGPNSYAKSYTATASGGIASFDLSGAALTVAGTYTYTASVTSSTASPVKTVAATEAVTAGAAATVTASSGGGQKAVIDTAFAAPLVVAVVDKYGNQVSGAVVSFSAPSSGAGATFSSATSTTGAAGTASMNATANGTVGSYTVTAATGAATSASFSLTNQQGTPTLSWATPAAIVYGTALSATQLNATASVPGTFAYTPAAEAVLQAGNQTLSVTFTPTDSTDYTTATTTVTLQVTQATPALTWATPAAINFGTALSSTQLNATALVPGTFAYNPAAGTVPAVGSDTLSVTFTPTDATDFTTATATVTLVVNSFNPAPVVTSLTPALTSAGSAAFSLTVNGAGFVNGSTVYWGSTALTTQFVSATQLTASVPASLVVSAGTGVVTVQTPAPGGGTSNSLHFEIDTAGTGSGTTPVFASTTATVAAGSTASYSVTLPSGATDISVSCLNAPSGVTCSYSSGTVSIATSSTTPKGTYQIIVIFNETLPGAATSMILVPFLLLPLYFLRRRLTGRRVWLGVSMLLVLLVGALAATGCGGSSHTTTTVNQTHTVNSSAAVTLTVQ